MKSILGAHAQLEKVNKYKLMFKTTLDSGLLLPFRNPFLLKAMY